MRLSRVVAMMVLLGGVAAAVEAKDARKPNVVVIVADDLGYADIGVQAVSKAALMRGLAKSIRHFRATDPRY